MQRRGTKYLILGAGAAGIYAAIAIRLLDADGSLMIVTRERTRPYKRPVLSKSPLLSLRRANLNLLDDTWFQEQKVDFLYGQQVLSMDIANKCVCTDKETLYYEKCIYALGGVNFIPPFPGRELAGVLTVRSLEDLYTLKRCSVGVENAVVIGGGVVGLELALEMKKYGMNITILEAMPRLMPRQLDRGTSEKLLEFLSGTFPVYTNVNVAEIRGQEQVTSVFLEDGREFPCGLVVVSCGQKPCVEIAKTAGIACGRSVIVNQRMETSVGDVWACGDCAEWNGMNAALWLQAMSEGFVAGTNAAGGKKEMKPYDCSLILNGETVNLFALGDLGMNSEKEYTCVTRTQEFDTFTINKKPKYAIEKRFYWNGHMTGGCILGNLSGMEEMKRELVEET